MKPVFTVLALLLLTTFGAYAVDQNPATGTVTWTIQALAALDTEPNLSTDVESPDFLAAEDSVNFCPFPPPNPPLSCICGSCCDCGACWIYPGGPGQFCGFGEN